MKPYVLFSTLLLFVFVRCGAQTAEVNSDTLSAFPGGEAAMQKFISDNLLTTREALSNHIAGDVELGFVVDEKGYIGDIKTVKKLGYGCDEQAIRVLRLMPRWQPGVIGGRKIKTSFQHSFHFTDAMKANETETTVSRNMLPDAPLQFGQKEEDLAAYITTHFTYPSRAPNNLPGTLVLQFRVNEDGSTGDIQIVAGLGQGFDEEAIRVIKNMPPWMPKQTNFRPAASYKELVLGFKKGKALLY